MRLADIASDFTCVYCAAAGTIFWTTYVCELIFLLVSLFSITIKIAQKYAFTGKLSYKAYQRSQRYIKTLELLNLSKMTVLVIISAKLPKYVEESWSKTLETITIQHKRNYKDNRLLIKLYIFDIFLNITHLELESFKMRKTFCISLPLFSKLMSRARITVYARLFILHKTFPYMHLLGSHTGNFF